MNDQGDFVYVDDEGLLNGAAVRYGMFMLTFAVPVGEPYRVALAGYGLVLGSSAIGESCDAAMNLADLQAMVEFQINPVHDEFIFQKSALGVDNSPDTA